MVFPIGKYESTVTTPFPGNSVGDNLTPIPAVICVTIPDKAWPLPKYVSASTVFAMTVCATDTFVAETNPTVAIPETVNTFDKLGLNATGRMLFGDEETAKDQRKKVSELRDQLAKLKNDEFQFEEDIKAKKKQAAEEEKQRQQELIDKEKEKRKAIQDRINDELAQIKQNNKQALAENQARLRTEQENEEFAVNEKYNAQIALAKKYGKDTTQLELAQANEINEIRLKYQQEEYAKAEELRQKELAAIKEANRLKIEAENEFQSKIEEIDEANFQARLQKSMTEDEYALELVRQKYFALEEAAKGNAEQLAIIEAAKALEIEAIDKKSKEKQIAAENELRQKRLQLAGQAFTAIGDIIGSFTAKNDKDARKQFEIQKAFNLAAAVTNTAMAVTGALTAGGNPIKLATGTQFVEAGIAAAVGAANIIKIASSKFGSGASGGSGGGSPAGGGGGGMVQSPNFSIIGSSGVNQLAQLQQQPVQAGIPGNSLHRRYDLWCEGHAYCCYRRCCYFVVGFCSGCSGLIEPPAFGPGINL